MTCTEALETASRLLERPDARTAGLWPRAAAFLTRQALEEALDERWRVQAPALSQVPTSAQLICLREYLDDPALAADLRHAWSALSAACHHHPYEMPPTAAELRQWIDTVSAFVKQESA
jgi:hypothetical protein